jgi:hypothetical protein
MHRGTEFGALGGRGSPKQVVDDISRLSKRNSGGGLDTRSSALILVQWRTGGGRRCSRWCQLGQRGSDSG